MGRHVAPLDHPRHPVSTAIRTRETQLLTGIDDGVLAAIGADPTHSEFLRSLGVTSYLAVPLVLGQQTIGAVTFAFSESGRVHTASDVSLAEELARRAAVAVENARLYAETEARAQAAQALEFVGDGVFLVGADGVIRSGTPPRSGSPASPQSTSSATPPADVLATWPPPRGGRAAAHLPDRGRRPGALAVALGGPVRGRHRLRVPRPDRGAGAGAVEERLRLDGLARAADAPRGDLRRRDDPPADGRRPRRRAAVTACSAWSRTSPNGSRGSSTTSSGRAGSTRACSRSRSRAATRARSPGPSPPRRGRTCRTESSSTSTSRSDVPADRRRPGQGAPGARQPRRQRGQVLARRRSRGAAGGPLGRARALLVVRSRPRHPALRARAHLREVLPARPEPHAWRRRHRARPLHLPRAGAPHERPTSGSSRARAKARRSASSCRSPDRSASTRAAGPEGPAAVTRRSPVRLDRRAVLDVGRGAAPAVADVAGPPHDDQKSMLRSRPAMPTTSRITPTAVMSRPLHLGVHGPRQDGADCDQEDADSETHWWFLLRLPLRGSRVQRWTGRSGYGVR